MWVFFCCSRRSNFVLARQTAPVKSKIFTALTFSSALLAFACANATPASLRAAAFKSGLEHILKETHLDVGLFLWLQTLERITYVSNIFYSIKKGTYKGSFLSFNFKDYASAPSSFLPSIS